jgi:hypothetical protein
MTECNTLSIPRGSDWSAELAFKDDADVPIDYSGALLSAVLVLNTDDAEILSPVSMWTDAGQGQAILSLDETETLTVPMGVLSRLRITTVTTGGITKIWPSALVEGI